MQEIVNLLPETGSVTFVQFMSDCRSNGLNAALWLRAKHSGLLHTFYSEGVLMVERGNGNGG